MFFVTPNQNQSLFWFGHIHTNFCFCTQLRCLSQFLHAIYRGLWGEQYVHSFRSCKSSGPIILLRHTLASLQYDAAVCLEQGVELTPHMLAFLHNICHLFFFCSVFLSCVPFMTSSHSAFVVAFQLCSQTFAGGHWSKLLGLMAAAAMNPRSNLCSCPYCWCFNMLFFGCSNTFRSAFRFHNYSSKNPSLSIIIIRRIVWTKWLQPGLSLALHVA